jgi:hypothetical protein
MFRAARQSAKNKLRKLTIVNPDEQATRRIAQVIDDGAEGTAVMRLGTWEDLVERHVGEW